MEEQERHTDRFLRSKKIEKHKKKSKLFFRKMPCLSAYLHESLDFFKVGILQKIQTFGFAAPNDFDNTTKKRGTQYCAPRFFVYNIFM